jgi:hypothetical protein
MKKRHNHDLTHEMVKQILDIWAFFDPSIHVFYSKVICSLSELWGPRNQTQIGKKPWYMPHSRARPVIESVRGLITNRWRNGNRRGLLDSPVEYIPYTLWIIASSHHIKASTKAMWTFIRIVHLRPKVCLTPYRPWSHNCTSVNWILKLK